MELHLNSPPHASVVFRTTLFLLSSLCEISSLFSCTIVFGLYKLTFDILKQSYGKCPSFCTFDTSRTTRFPRPLAAVLQTIVLLVVMF